MKLIVVLSAITALFSAVNAIGLAHAAPAPAPEVIDINKMKVRARGTVPPPISPAREEYAGTDTEDAAKKD